MGDGTEVSERGLDRLELEEIRRRLDFLAEQRLLRPPTLLERQEWDRLARREMDLLRWSAGS